MCKINNDVHQHSLLQCLLMQQVCYCATIHTEEYIEVFFVISNSLINTFKLNLIKCLQLESMTTR